MARPLQEIKITITADTTDLEMALERIAKKAEQIQEAHDTIKKFEEVMGRIDRLSNVWRMPTLSERSCNNDMTSAIDRMMEQLRKDLRRQQGG